MERPILFNTEMVRAILDGRKTVTRRVIKPQPPMTTHIMYTCGQWAWAFWEDGDKHWIKSPYKPMDILYVRESFSPNYFCNAVANYRYGELRGNRNAYKADYYKEKIGDVVPEPKWIPSIHMPKEAARIFLRVTDVKVERLQEITDKGAEAEGIPTEYPMVGTYHPDSLGYMDVECPDCASKIVRFENLWNSTIKPADRDKYGWEANPWVFVIEFEKINPSEVK